MKAEPSESGRTAELDRRESRLRAEPGPPPGKDRGVQAVYDYWLGLIPQFFAQMGAMTPGGNAGAGEANPALAFPVDQVARAATMTQQALTAMAQAYTPLLQMAGAPGLLGQWNAASSFMPAMGAAGALMPAMPSVETLPQALRELGTQWLDAPRALAASFDRTFGALADALGFGPVRKLQAAWKDLVAASFAQNEARGNYVLLVQRAFAIGLDRLMHRLAEMADKGERVESMLALMRMWAVHTEEAVHEVLQSDEGLATTANVTRAGLAYRRKIQHLAAIIADSLDMATRSDVDEAFREIQELKREVRALRAATVPAKRPARVPQLSKKEVLR